MMIPTEVHWRLSLAAVAAFVCSCGTASQPLDLLADSQAPLSYLELTCEVSSEPSGAKALALEIHNPSVHTIDEVRVVIDGIYSAALEDLRTYLGFWSGSRPLGRSSIRPGETLLFPFSHDITNHALMKSEQGASLPTDVIPSRITILSRGQSGDWRVQ